MLTECAAILRHAARQVPEKGLWPTDLREQAAADEWLGWLACNHHVTYAHVRRPERYTEDEGAFEGIKAKAANTYADLATMTEVRLSHGGWAVGERFSVVDAYLMVFWFWANGPVLRFDMAGRFPAWTSMPAASPSARRFKPSSLARDCRSRADAIRTRHPLAASGESA